MHKSKTEDGHHVKAEYPPQGTTEKDSVLGYAERQQGCWQYQGQRVASDELPKYKSLT